MGISENVLKNIKENEIEKKSDFQFKLEKTLNYLLIIAGVVISGLSLAIAIESLLSLDLDVVSRSSSNLFEYLITSIPILLIFVSIALFFGIYLDITRTTKSYRHTKTIVLTSIIGGITVFVLFFIVTGLGKVTDRIFRENLPLYSIFSPYNNDFWVQPQNGLLAGNVVRIIDEDEFLLLDERGSLWNVQLIQPVESNVAFLRINDNVRLFGEVIEQLRFIASEVRVDSQRIIIRRFVNIYP